MESSLMTLLLSSADLASLVDTRIKWNRIAAPATPPYAILRRISGRIDYKMDGASGLSESRLQVDCYGSTYSSAKSVARAFQKALSGYSGAVGATKFDGVFLLAERDMIDEDETTADLHAVSLDFIIWHKEN